MTAVPAASRDQQPPDPPASVDPAVTLEKPRPWFASLEGIRGWGFIMVCVFHYGGAFKETNTHGRWLYPWFLANQLSWIAVPLFFVLSGFLITGILYDTRNRPDFFRTFYLRRAIRIWPLYYVLLALVALAAVLFHYRIFPKFAIYLVYLNNMVPSRSVFTLGDGIELGHLWSLAVEEQFYAFWPVAIWLVKDRAKLIKLCYAIIAVSFGLRAVWPAFHLPVIFASYCTFTRADTLIFGALLALYQRGPGFELKKLMNFARIAVVGGFGAMILNTIVAGNALPFSYWGIVALIPLVNVICLGILILVLQPGTFLNRICSQRWACEAGRISYGMYAIHLLYRPWIVGVVRPFLAERVGTAAARIAIVFLALGLSWGLSVVAYRFVEAPALRWKQRLEKRARERQERLSQAPMAAAAES